MAAARHTPGPWSVEDPFGPEILSIVAGGPEVFDWIHVAQLSAEGRREDGDPTKAEAKANARLIAAGPELFDLALLLERTISYEIARSKREGDDEGARLKTCTLNLVRSVIAKVRPL